jgi:ABC-type sugar transport system permease subunit
MEDKKYITKNPLTGVKKRIGGLIYSARCAVFRAFHKGGVKHKKHGKRRTGETVFYVSVIALPLLQFCIFYIGVNANSLALSFRSYDTLTGAYSFAGFKNFADFAHRFVSDSVLKSGTVNSLILYFVGLIVGLPLSLLFSYYIAKKMPSSGFFRVMLFVPSIISAVVTAIMYTLMTDRILPEIMKKLGVTMEPLFSSASTRFGAIVFYNVWISFGTSVLLYAGSMSQISESVSESARLDGANSMQEFIHIALPSVYPVITTFLVVGIAQIFMNQGAIYTFYQDSPPDPKLYTLGYYLFVRVIGRSASLADYPYAAAGGLLFTCVAIPLTLLGKWALEKFGPKEA